MTTPGHNSGLGPEEMATVATLTREINQIETKVKAMNADKNAKRKAIKAIGLDLDAWRASKRRQEMDPDDRAEFDRSHEVCNKALGVPLQAGLFDDSEDIERQRKEDGEAFDNADANIPAGALN